MRETIYDDDGLTVFKENNKLYIRYDAGSHQVSIREDEISEEEARLVKKGTEDATKVLLSLQAKIEDSGGNPYESNISK